MLKIEIPGHMVDTLSELIEKLGGKVVSEKLSKDEKKQQILDGLEESVEFINLHLDGKVKARSVEDLLNELSDSNYYNAETIHLTKSKANRKRLQEAIDEMNSGVFLTREVK